MQRDHSDINPYSDTYRQQVLTIWKKSVLATHDFLTSSDFEEIKELVNNINFHYCPINNLDSQIATVCT